MIKRTLRRAAQILGYDVIRLKSGAVYDRDGLYTNHNHDFTRDAKFAAAYQRAVSGTTGNSKNCHGEWRTHIAIWAASNAMKLGGNFVECGVYLGFMSSAIMTYLRWNDSAGDRRFILIDNFEGVVNTLLTDEEKAIGRAQQYGSSYSSTYDRAKTNLGEFRNAEIVRGEVPGILRSIDPGRVAFLHLDMNATIPEIEAMRFFWPRLQPGAFVVLDDYAFVGYAPQKSAFDALASELGFAIASLPTGQGLIVNA